jgi:DNA-binding LytR/AlgR family response regulator
VAILGTTILLVLLAWEQHLTAQLRRAPRFEPAPPTPTPAPGAWLDFPESPLLRVRADDVVLIRSAGNYSEIVAHGRAHLVRATLSELSDRLAPLGFVRVHRQTVINARNVRALIHLACGNAVPVGRRYMGAIDALTR